MKAARKRKIAMTVDLCAFGLAFLLFLINSILDPSLWSIAITIMTAAAGTKTAIQFRMPFRIEEDKK